MQVAEHRLVSLGILSREVTDCAAVDIDTDGVAVIRVVRLGHEHDRRVQRLLEVVMHDDAVRSSLQRRLVVLSPTTLSALQPAKGTMRSS